MNDSCFFASSPDIDEKAPVPEVSQVLAYSWPLTDAPQIANSGKTVKSFFEFEREVLAHRSTKNASAPKVLTVHAQESRSLL